VPAADRGAKVSRPVHRVVLALVAAFTLAATTALANGPEIGIDAGYVVPVASTAVSLAGEWVVIDLPLDAVPDGPEPIGSMTCVYHLHNPLPRAVRVPMAFVVPQPEIRYGLRPPTDEPGLRLSARLGRMYPAPDETLAVRRMPVSRAAWGDLVSGVPDSLPTWTVPIPADTTVVLLVSSKVTWSRFADGESDDKRLTYCTRPARMWKGPIGHAEIEFRFG